MRFVFVIAFRNVAPYIQECYESLLNQNYKNWIAIFCDDASTDGTIDLIPDLPNFIVRVNETRQGSLACTYNAIVNSNLNDDDIICTLDGDDYLIGNNAIDLLVDLYHNKETLLTYGQFQFSDGRIGICEAYTPESFAQLRIAKKHIASQLRTFKYKAYKEMIRQDPELNCYRDANGDFYTLACDVALMTPLLEIAGLDRIIFNDIPLYFYRLHHNNVHASRSELQKSTGATIFAKAPFQRMA